MIKRWWQLWLVSTGHEKGDINSTAFLHDIVDKPILFSKFADMELAKDLLMDLETSKELSAQIQVQKNCFSADPLKSLFKNCRPVCAWAERKNKSKNMDIVSRYLLQPIFEKTVQKARKLINNSSFKIHLKSRRSPLNSKSFQKIKVFLLRFGFINLTLGSDILLKLCFCEMILKFLSKEDFCVGSTPAEVKNEKLKFVDYQYSFSIEII